MEKRIKITEGIDIKELFGNLDINIKLMIRGELFLQVGSFE